MNVTLKQLRYFAALSRHGHFGKAAEDCAISQPALSLQMKELETNLGAPLLERRDRKLHLTSLGEAFAQRTREILCAVDELGELPRASNGPLTGPLRLGVIPTIAPYMLPAIIRKLVQYYPKLDLHPREATTDKLIDNLHEGKLDAAIIALPITAQSLTSASLFNEEFMLVRPAADKDQPVPDLESLRYMRLLLLEEGHCLRDHALAYCNLGGWHDRDLMSGSSLTTLVQMVAENVGVTLIPEMAVPIETRSTKVSISRLPDPRPTRSIGMVWRKSNPLTLRLNEIAGIIRTIPQNA